MKLFKKVKKENGLRQIYFMGVKVFCFKKQNFLFYVKKILLKWWKSKSLFYLSQCDYKTTNSLDILIPTTDKDLNRLELVLKSLKNINNPIQNIYIVAPKSEFIKQFCEKFHCIYLDENSVLPIKLSDIHYCPKGINRSGWIFQQLIKLNADCICKNKNVLVLDSDTIFNKKQSFIAKGKVVFDCSDEYHAPYFKAYSSCLGLNKRFALSFVAHHMLFQRSRLKEMKLAIEKHTNKKWYKAILEGLDKGEVSSFSEYEMYGNWMYYHHRKEIFLREWYNFSTTFEQMKNLPLSKFKRYKTISMHSYNDGLIN